MATTTNFGWETPDDTDLVKDGAAAIRTALGGVDTSFVDLKGGTSGQILSKASNTDLDFAWVADAGGISPTIIDAKGDLIAGTAADTAGRLAVGTNDSILMAASGEATGLKWAGTWTTYTPTRNAITVGNGTESARYQKIGKMVTVLYNFTLGSTSSIGNDPGIGLPFTPVGRPIGTVLFFDSGTMNYQGQFDYVSATGICYFQVGNSSGTYLASSYLTGGIPFTWTTNDQFNVSCTYEVA